MAYSGKNSNQVKLGVVIVNYVSYWFTINYIKNQLLTQNFVFYQIVIVDNCSPNESLDKLRKEFAGNKTLKILSNSANSGFAAGNNIGIKYLETIGCEYILISNNDIVIEDRKLLSKCIEQYKQLDNVAFISPVVLTGNKLKSEYSAWKLPGKMKEVLGSTLLLKSVCRIYLKRYQYIIDIKSDAPLAVDCLPGSIFMGSAASFSDIGYFDENTFLYYEETIIGKKVKDKGLQNYILQSLVCNHSHAQTIDLVLSDMKKFRILLRSRIYYWTAYMNAGKVFSLVLTFLYFILTVELSLGLPFRFLRKRSRPFEK